MAQLKSAMPTLNVEQADLQAWGQKWLARRQIAEDAAVLVFNAAEEKRKDAFDARELKRRAAFDAAEQKRMEAATAAKPFVPKNFAQTVYAPKVFDPLSVSGAFARDESVQFATLFDRAFGKALGSFLGDIPVVAPAGDSLLPPRPDCVEVGATRIVGGIRPQNYDAAYRPDGPRVVLDSKSLNDRKSIGKNWQNMINDVATEAATIHTRFPYAVVAFMIVLPKPVLEPKQRADIITTLERLGTREHVLDQHHLAEAIALVVWDPETGLIDDMIPGVDSSIGLKSFSEKIARYYTERYKGLPPHGFVREAPGAEHDADLDEPQ